MAVYHVRLRTVEQQGNVIMTGLNDQNAELATRLGRLDTSLISDVLDVAGWSDQVITSAIRPLNEEMTLAGPAVCLRGEALNTDRPPQGKPVSAYTMDLSVYPGAVLVIETGQQAVGSTIGGLIALSLVGRGCVGVVNDGVVRDSGELIDLGLPVFTRHVTPVNAAGRWSLVESEGAIELPGLNNAPVKVAPQDMILADQDGIIVVPREIAEPIILAAERLKTIEAQIAARLRAGEDRETVFAEHPRFAHIKPMMERFLSSGLSDEKAVVRPQRPD